jgi:hypothetical protein
MNHLNQIEILDNRWVVSNPYLTPLLHGYTSNYLSIYFEKRIELYTSDLPFTGVDRVQKMTELSEKIHVHSLLLSIAKEVANVDLYLKHAMNTSYSVKEIVRHVGILEEHYKGYFDYAKRIQEANVQCFEKERKKDLPQ